MNESTTQPPIIRTATVRVAQPVDGTRRRKKPRPSKAARKLEKHIIPDKRVMAMALKVKLPTQKIVPVSSSEVLIVNK